MNANGTLQILDEWGDIELGNFAGVEALKQVNPTLKTIISIGGWNAGNGILTAISATPEYRSNLIQSSLEYFDKYGFNGLDIDWEYPEAKDRVQQYYIIFIQYRQIKPLNKKLIIKNA